MTSKRNLERRLDDVEAPAVDGQFEIVITDHVVLERGADPIEASKTRVWRDDSGEWQREQVFDRRDEVIDTDGFETQP